MVPPLPENMKIIDMVEPDTELPQPAKEPVKEEKKAVKEDNDFTFAPPPPPLPPVENKGTNWSNPEFRKRVLSAAVLAPLVLLAVALGGAAFYTLILVTAVLMMREWDALIQHRISNTWGTGGVVYVTATCLSLILLREESLGGSLPLLLFLLAAVWATDIGAYFAGRQIGGPKLAPRLSPSKTWAGMLGGMLAAATVGAILAFFYTFPVSPWQGLVIGAVLAVVGQMGDLFESWLKRQAGVKDSGVLIPGHGGILDRVDGLTFTAPLLLLLFHILAVTPVVPIAN